MPQRGAAEQGHAAGPGRLRHSHRILVGGGEGLVHENGLSRLDDLQCVGQMAFPGNGQNHHCVGALDQLIHGGAVAVHLVEALVFLFQGEFLVLPEHVGKAITVKSLFTVENAGEKFSVAAGMADTTNFIHLYAPLSQAVFP